MNVSTSGSKKKVGEVATVGTTLTWRINKISEYLGENCQLSDIESPVFKTKSCDGKHSWELSLSTDDDDCKDSKNDKTYFEIYLTSLNPKVVRATVNFSVLDFFNKEIELRTLDNQEFQPQASWGFEQFIERQLLTVRGNQYSWDDCLTIVCTITTGKFIEVEAQKDIVKGEEQQKLLEFQTFAKLLNEPKFSDIVFVIKEQEIHAHQCILANKSPTFEAMFTSEMSKTKNNRVEISDVGYAAMRDTISYIYTGIVPKYEGLGKEPGKSYMDLLIAADKYQIDYLKKECEEKLSDDLKVGNIFEYLHFSYMNNASYLKEKAIEFIVDYGKEIVERPTFKKHCNELNGGLVSEVFEALVIKKRRIE